MIFYLFRVFGNVQFDEKFINNNQEIKKKLINIHTIKTSYKD